MSLVTLGTREIKKLSPCFLFSNNKKCFLFFFKVTDLLVNDKNHSNCTFCNNCYMLHVLQDLLVCMHVLVCLYAHVCMGASLETEHFFWISLHNFHPPIHHLTLLNLELTPAVATHGRNVCSVSKLHLHQAMETGCLSLLRLYIIFSPAPRASAARYQWCPCLVFRGSRFFSRANFTVLRKSGGRGSDVICRGLRGGEAWRAPPLAAAAANPRRGAWCSSASAPTLAPMPTPMTHHDSWHWQSA